MGGGGGGGVGEAAWKEQIEDYSVAIQVIKSPARERA